MAIIEEVSVKRTVSAYGAFAYDASATRTASVPVGVSASTATRSVSVSVLVTRQKNQYYRRCKNGCGRLYKDWYGELVCPVCGYHEYVEEDNEDRGTDR